MSETKKLYLHFVERLQVREKEVVTLGKVAALYIEDKSIKETLQQLPLHVVSKSDGRFSVLSPLTVIEKIHTLDPKINVISSLQTEIVLEQKDPNKLLKSVWIFFIWWLLFIGSGLAIMNFHEDVSMEAVHEKLYYLLTGEKSKHPYALQIPYSIGIAVGMILFFNHIFKKRFNDEPSPLEVEMFNYQEDLDRYIKVTEKTNGDSE